MNEAITVLTTTASADEAKALATALVERRLAACAQSLPIMSCYAWQGEIRHDAEILLLIKTRRELYERVEAAIRELHSYETPEIVALPLVAGSSAYLDWIQDSTEPATAL